MEDKISLALETDLEQINQLYIKRIKWFNDHNIKQWSERYAYIYDVSYLKEQMKINQLYVVKNDGIVLGSMLLKNDDNQIWSSNDNAYYIHHLVTDINVRGVGVQLIKFAIKKCIDDGKDYLRLDTVSKNIWLNDYYKKLGFEFYGYKEMKGGAENLWQMKIKR